MQNKTRKETQVQKVSAAPGKEEGGLWYPGNRNTFVPNNNY